MTIAAGFVCTDGIVIGADTEYSNSVVKEYRSKIWRSQDERCVIAAAGDEVLMKEAAETLLTCLDSEYSVEDVKEQFQDTMQAIHERFIDYSNDPSFTLRMLVAAQASDGLVLFRQSRWAVTDVKAYACIGSGEAFGNYVAKRFFGELKPQPITAGIVCASHLLRLAKNHVQGCGGTRSEIVILPARGRAYEQSERNVRNVEVLLDGVDAVLGPLLFAIPDSSIPMEAIEERLKVFCEGVRATRPFPFDLTVQLTGVGAMGLIGQLVAAVIEPSTPIQPPTSGDPAALPGPEDPIHD